MGKIHDKKTPALDTLETEIAALAKSHRIHTEEGRALANFMVRLVEALRYGEPKTPPISHGSHHA